MVEAQNLRKIMKYSQREHMQGQGKMDVRTLLDMCIGWLLKTHLLLVSISLIFQKYHAVKW